MGFKQKIEKTLTKFGSNNSPTFVAMSIAAAKGIFRPAFTMSDKKESAETKRYTAIREGLTEIIAIPVYYISGVAAQKIASELAKEKNFVSKNTYDKYIKGDKSKEVLNAVENARKLAEINLPKMKSNAAFIGVCMSALIVIPLICSIAIKPIMNKITSVNKSDKHKEKKVYPANNVIKASPLSNTFKGYRKYSISGMKVGGV